MVEMLSQNPDKADNKATKASMPSGRVPASSIPTAATLEFATRLASEGQRKYLDRDYEDAEQLLQKSLEIRERAPNVGTSGLMESLTALAAVHVARGDLDRAEPLLERALAGSEQLLGPQHPGLSSLLSNLAHVYYKRRKHESAERLLTRLVAIKTASGTDEAELAAVLASLAIVREASGHIAAARQLWLRVLSIRESTLGVDSPAVAAALEHLGELSAAAGHLEQAVSLRARALAIRERSLSPGDASLHVARDKIASLRAAVDARIARAQTPPHRPRGKLSDVEVTPNPKQLADKAPSGTPQSVPIAAILQALASVGGERNGLADRVSGRLRALVSGRSSDRVRSHRDGVESAFATAPSALSGSRTFGRNRPVMDDDVLDEDDIEEDGTSDDAFAAGDSDESLPASNFDPFSDRAWPKTKLIGGIVCLVALLAVAVTLIASTDNPGVQKSALQPTSGSQLVGEGAAESEPIPARIPSSQALKPADSRGTPDRLSDAQRRQHALDNVARRRTDSLARSLRGRTAQSRVPHVRAIVPQ